MLAIPPPIYYPDLKKSTITTKSSTARTPDPVRSWTSFVEKVESHEFDKLLNKVRNQIFRSRKESPKEKKKRNVNDVPMTKNPLLLTYFSYSKPKFRSRKASPNEK